MLNNKEKTFQCSYDGCDKSYTNKGNLKRHIDTIHKKIKNFECDKCEFKFYKKTKLKRHINSVHLKIKNFECDKCEYKCNTNTNLKRHINICTGKENISSGEYKCRECLKDMNIEYKHNTTYKIKHKKYLKWDFIIYKNNKVVAFIEYDGEQHFKPRYFGSNGTKEDALQELELNKLRDNIKNNFCLDKKYPILRIPYTQYNNIKQLITEFINEQ